jgi:hypothetical protein
LNSRFICHHAHRAAEGVYFTHQMPFGDTAYRGVAGHLGDHSDIHRAKSSFRPQSGRNKRCFASGMPSAYHNNIVIDVKIRHDYHFSKAEISRWSHGFQLIQWASPHEITALRIGWLSAEHFSAHIKPGSRDEGPLQAGGIFLIPVAAETLGQS